MRLLSLVTVFFFVAFSAFTPVESKYNIGFINSEQGNYLDTYMTSVVNAFNTKTSAVFNPVKLLNASFDVINSTDLIGLDAVFVWADYDFVDSVTLGNALADFIDNGGGVVVGIFAVASGSSFNPARRLLGRFTPTYDVTEWTTIFTGDKNLDADRIYFPEHPVMKGITNLTTTYIPLPDMNITEGSYVLARYQTGAIFAAVKDHLGPSKKSRVDLSFWIEDSFYDNHDNTPYAQVVEQSLLYVINGSFLEVDINACSVPDAFAYLNSTYSLPSNTVVTQSIPAGTTLTQNSVTSWNVTVSVAESGTFTLQGSINAGASCSTGSSSGSANSFSHSLFSLFVGF